MVIVPVEFNNKKITITCDNWLYKSIQTIKQNVHKKDKDRVTVVDGAEGGGKSVFAMQYGKLLDPTLCLDRICFNPKEFHDAVVKAKKGQCVIYDEAFTGLSSRSSLAEVNRSLVSLMMEMRQKNLFVIIVMPTIFLLDKYAALWRAKELFHIYTKDGKRGRWVYFNHKKKKLLYMTGRKYYEYNFPKSKRRGKFKDTYVIDELEYRAKKSDSLKNKSKITKSENFKKQRDVLFNLLNRKYGIPQLDISKACRKFGFVISRNRISELVAEIDKKYPPDTSNESKTQ